MSKNIIPLSEFAKKEIVQIFKTDHYTDEVFEFLFHRISVYCSIQLNEDPAVFEELSIGHEKDPLNFLKLQSLITEFKSVFGQVSEFNKSHLEREYLVQQKIDTGMSVDHAYDSSELGLDSSKEFDKALSTIQNMVDSQVESNPIVKKKRGQKSLIPKYLMDRITGEFIKIFPHRKISASANSP